MNSAVALAEQDLHLTISADRPLVTLGLSRAPYLHHIVLDGLQPRHAEVVRTEDDELVLRPVVPGTVRVHGAVVLREALLRTGTRVELGPWTLVYAREEYADHGRPFGGRIGGELGRQRPQPPREELLHRRR